jgi:hypothetical protein
MKTGDTLKSRQHDHPNGGVAQLQCSKVVEDVASNCSCTIALLIIHSIIRRREVTGVPLSLTVIMLCQPYTSSSRKVFTEEFFIVMTHSFEQ